jgi:hypothetical protein
MLKNIKNRNYFDFCLTFASGKNNLNRVENVVSVKLKIGTFVIYAHLVIFLEYHATFSIKISSYIITKNIF